MRLSIVLALALFLGGCANHSELMLPSAGNWTSDTVVLGPVFSCRGGNLDFSADHEECNKWPLSIPSLPHPDTHYAELRTKAAQQYQVDVATIVLKDVQVVYNTEMVGTIRGWKVTAIAGRNLHSGLSAPLTRAK